MQNNFNFPRMIEILNETGPSDWQLSSMICKLLMNYSEKSKPINSNFIFFENDELKVLRVILKELLDENFALRNTQIRQMSTISNGSNSENDQQQQFESEENINEYMNYLWKQDFFPVATFLLKRLTEEF
jgi:hypothetical protein